MNRSWGITAACLLFAVSACSGERSAPTESKPPSSSAAVPASPAKVTAACPFLPLDEVRQLMGDVVYGGQSRQQEERPERLTETGGTHFRCSYRGDDRIDLVVHPGDLTVTDLSQAAQKQCTGPVTVVPRSGDQAAWYCDAGTDTVLTSVAKRSHGEIRTAIVYLFPKIKAEAYTTIANRLAERL